MTKVLDKPLVVTSPVFVNNEIIPSKYTCIGSDINPAITITDIPDDTKSLALIIDDPNAPNGPFDHWVMWNIPVTGRINENSSPAFRGKMEKAKTNTWDLVRQAAHIITISKYMLSIQNWICLQVQTKICFSRQWINISLPRGGL